MSALFAVETYDKSITSVKSSHHWQLITIMLGLRKGAGGEGGGRKTDEGIGLFLYDF